MADPTPPPLPWYQRPWAQAVAAWVQRPIVMRFGAKLLGGALLALSLQVEGPIAKWVLRTAGEELTQQAASMPDAPSALDAGTGDGGAP